MGHETNIEPAVVAIAEANEQLEEEKTDYEKFWDAVVDDLLAVRCKTGQARKSCDNKRIINKMRRLSISELNRHGKTAQPKYKIAFYVILISISMLFLYLIYQNLFNDR